MAVYQDKAKERIKKGMRKMKNVVERANRENYKEADTRKIVSDMICEVLGWDKYANLTAEQMIGTGYADYVIKKDGEELFVVEVKQMGLKLKEAHLTQARHYAIDEGIDWIILTNGDEWQVYFLDRSNKIYVAKHVFTVCISDDMKSADKAEMLYLLSEEANRKRELEDYYSHHIALSGENLADHILSDEVINKLRISLKNSTGQKLTNSEIATALINRLFQPDVITESHQRAQKRMEKMERQK